VQNQDFKIMGCGAVGATMGKTIFKCVLRIRLLKKISSRSAAPGELKIT
jgi:hypothetical protein